MGTSRHTLTLVSADERVTYLMEPRSPLSALIPLGSLTLTFENTAIFSKVLPKMAIFAKKKRTGFKTWHFFASFNLTPASPQENIDSTPLRQGRPVRVDLRQHMGGGSGSPR